MPTVNAVSISEPLIEQNVVHIERSAEVVFVKRLRDFSTPGSASILLTNPMRDGRTQHQAFREEFFEFIKGSPPVLTRNTALDNLYKSPDDKLPLYAHYQVISTSEPQIGSHSTASDLAPAELNTDVVRVAASLTVEGRGQCTIILNNRLGTYTFSKHPVRKGQPIFESNDLVFVNLSGLDGKLHRVFTGFITAVASETIVADTLQTLLTITCDDYLKPLFESRTNVRPSGSLQENDGEEPTGLNIHTARLAPHEIMAMMLSNAYGDIYMIQGMWKKLDKWARDARTSVLQPIMERRTEMDRIHMLPHPQLGPMAASSALPSGTFMLPEGETRSTAPSQDIQQLVTISSTPVTIPKRVYGFRRPYPRTVDSADDVGRAAVAASPAAGIDSRDLAWTIEGTAQPAYDLSFSGNIPLLASDWKSSLAIGEEIAQRINYELYADATGIVRFRPRNVLLPFDFLPREPRYTTDDLGPTGSLGRVGTEYWLRSQFISHESYSGTDAGIFSIAYVFGKGQTFDVGDAIFGAAADADKFDRLGPRHAPAVQQYNLKTSRGCKAYARAYLNRLNSNARTAMITYLGDSRLQPGNPVYIEHRQEVYYVAAVAHDFAQGQGYTTALTLKYGRRPLGIRTSRIGDPDKNPFSILRGVSDPDLLSLMKSLDIQLVLARKKEAGALLAQGRLFLDTTTEEDYIRQGIKDKGLLFLDYVWEPMYPLTYEDLSQTAQRQGQASLATEIATSATLGSRRFKNEKRKQKQKAAAEQKTVTEKQATEGAMKSMGLLPFTPVLISFRGPS